ncbi:TrmH family RNA methyltransferase [Sulfuritortus calidifontis]|uniref:TrmH family RNA methyltransferase n=1 Tax=Sulfuritortus calidifontis TaxID=1914471 RepID=A0A4R3K003_9PROT|nr:RNA methyltransferase [Sulfuritortus calidifontis]TCS72886.1 TrmH family RNA methyltransferase [Sulfuritortus calidifontis]
MSVKAIHSRDNAEFRFLKNLAEEARARREAGLTLLDGWHLIEAALQAGLKPEKLILTEGVVMPAGAQALLETLPVLSLSEALMRALAPVKTPTGLMALLRIPQPAKTRREFAILLEDIQDPGNLGAVLRSAAAAGVQVVYLSKGCTDAWSPKALRGGQGAQFQLAIVEGADLAEVAAEFPGGVYAAVLGAEAALYQLELTGAVAFAFGNEGAGLSRSLQACCQPFSIPMPGRVESLNVATAAAVCLFERVRQTAYAGSGGRQ